MSLHTRQHGAVTVVKPSGPQSQEDAQAFGERLETLIGESRGRIVLDVADAPFFDSIGLEALADAGDAMRAAGQALRLCGVHPNLREALELTKLDGLFEYFDDVSSAVRSFL